MERKNLIVLFPGLNYTVDMPLLYYANFKYELRGYEGIKINYGEVFTKEKCLLECLDNAKSVVLQQLTNQDFSKYNDIVFVSKSIGTILAGWLAKELNISVKHIFLTPLVDTLSYIKSENTRIVIAGAKDKHLDKDILMKHCLQEGVKLKVFEDVGHSLEVNEDINKNIEILKQVVDLF